MILDNNCRFKLGNFLQKLLNDPKEKFSHLLKWIDAPNGTFKIVDPQGLARTWGSEKNIPSMTYDKLSRAIRYYYKGNKMRKVPGQRQVYQFVFNSQHPRRLNDFEAYYRKNLLQFPFYKCSEN